MSQDQNLAFISVDEIRTNGTSLRTVDQKNPSFNELVESVKLQGVLNAINVSPAVDPDTQQPYYILVDGLQRLTAAKAAGLATIPAVIMSSSEIQILKRQIITNATRVETKHAEYAKQLMKILEMDPTTSTAQLAASINKSEAWLKDHLNLTKLCVEAASLVDEGKINPTSAIYLAKLPADIQPEYLEQAMTLPHTEFVPAVKARKTEIDKANREGRAANAAVFEPSAYLQKIGDIKTELESGANGNNVIGEQGLRTAQEGWKAALEWVLHLDAFSVAAQKAKHDEIVKTNEEKRRNAEIEREKKKLKLAEVRAERQKLSLKISQEGGDLAAALKAFDEAHATVS